MKTHIVLDVYYTATEVTWVETLAYTVQNEYIDAKLNVTHILILLLYLYVPDSSYQQIMHAV